ncbi:MAG: hypothetical protein K2J55_04895 [Eubacterium sp.]|nr:hypothetical protein [Eubacterium sp.]
MPENNNISNASLLPYNIDAEQAVLGSVLVDPNCMEIIIEKIKGEYFLVQQKKRFYGSLLPFRL